MGSVLVVVGDMLADQAEQMPLPEHDDVIKQFSAQCIHRSANPFCHGERGAIRNCWTPRLFTRASNAVPKIASRSRTSRTGATSAPIRQAADIRCQRFGWAVLDAGKLPARHEGGERRSDRNETLDSDPTAHDEAEHTASPRVIAASSASYASSTLPSILN